MNVSVNRVTLVGNLGRTPELRVTPKGTPTARFSLATNDSWLNRTTEDWYTSSPAVPHLRPTMNHRAHGTIADFICVRPGSAGVPPAQKAPETLALPGKKVAFICKPL
jgi:hypothetical protein